MIGKGAGERGAVWVARRIPDGHVSGHANQARITTFPRDDPANWRFADDVRTHFCAGSNPRGSSNPPAPALETYHAWWADA
jgi:hypothetical protein